ncbi:23S rRNA (adenine(2503)-C(2))-methyltransferase RlmN [Candidatus Falkowbacteria bacterium]|nr:23S rRNA (adenine(2503)-C(2))-methyltransferase RlmN [Candidatus Falkowbacteria bacterium]
MNLYSLEKILADEPAFRLKQAREAVFSKLIENWDEATNLSAALRGKLNEECPLKIDFKKFISDDGATIKFLITLTDDFKIESVLMRHEERNTVCVSSEVGCPLACAFCATGKMGFKRNLLPGEIIEQVLCSARFLKKEKQKVDSVVFMGMGEPFLNYENVLSAIKILNDKDGFGIGARHISISTAGVVEGIRKLAKESMQVNLAISLHAPNDKLRNEIMPVGKKYSIKKIMSAVGEYLEATDRKVMFEYLMIKNFNDKPEYARELAALLAELPRNLYFVNLILYNPTGGFEPSKKEAVQKFKEILQRAHVSVTERYRFGRGVKGACGQLAGGK